MPEKVITWANSPKVRRSAAHLGIGSKASQLAEENTGVMQIRPADSDDQDGIGAMVTKRVRWMKAQGLPVSTRVAEAMAEQAEDEAVPNWVLLDDGAIVGCTSIYTESPPWAFTEEEQAVPALFLASTCTTVALPFCPDLMLPGMT